nr:hypothetical protein BaRGS_030607 [Batillaria attramentaria]
MSRPRYSIAGELGKGGFGVVYLIKSDDGPKLALKTVDLRKIPPDYKARATEEAKILDQLNHKFLVHHVNSYIREPYLCIITEYCAAGDLDKFIERLGFVSGLPEKLIYMHTHNPVVLHRDLKPQNIYVTETGDTDIWSLGCVFYDITGKQGGAEMGAMFLLLQVMGGRKDLEELLGKSKYSRLGLKIVELQALEYGLYKKLKSMK